MRPKDFLSKNYHRLLLDPDKQHFVFGDIHGRYEPFMELLELIEYDESTHMLYSVGDLIDRGFHSVEVVDFFQQDNCAVARGNHEQFLVNFREWEDVWMIYQNGGPATLTSLAHHERSVEWLKDWCKTLPIVIDVGEDDDPNAFRLVHAELPMNIPDSDVMKFLRESTPVESGESNLLWGRQYITHALNNVKGNRPASDGVFRDEGHTRRNIFSGHTPTERIIRVHNHRWIDTGAGHTLTCVNPTTMESFSVPLFK